MLMTYKENNVYNVFPLIMERLKLYVQLNEEKFRKIIIFKNNKNNLITKN